MGKRGIWVRVMAALASGLLMAGIFAPYDFTALVWVALLPFLAAVWTLEGKKKAGRGFALGYLSGMVCFLIQLDWLSVVTGAGAIILPLYLALYWGVFGAFAATLGNPWGSSRLGATGIAFSNAAIWGVLEIARGWMLTGFGWNGLGIGLHDQLPMAQAADLLGVAGLSSLIIFVQAGVILAIGNRKWRPAVLALFTVAAMATYGMARIHLEHGHPSKRLTALLVQLNIPQEAGEVLWTAEQVHMGYEEETLKGLAAHASTPPDWVLWPETALTGRVLTTDDGTSAMWQANNITTYQVREGSTPFHLIFGAVELEGYEREGELVEKDPIRAYNSLVIQDPDLRLQTFRKHHLVIFGETIPFVDSIPLLQKIYEQQSGTEYGGSFLEGTTLSPLPVPFGPTSIGVIPTVCFEDTVPRLTRKFIRPGPQIIVNVTNDGWFKETQGAEQHFQNARFRAIELRRPMLRCANTGVSAAIDSTGSTRHPDTGMDQILHDGSGSSFTRGTLLTTLKVPWVPGFSLYACVGDAGLLTVGTLAFFLAVMRRKTKNVHAAL